MSRMIGRMTGTDVPACGFSIGFERLVSILMEQGLADGNTGRQIAGLGEEGFDFFSVFRADADQPTVEAVRKE